MGTVATSTRERLLAAAQELIEEGGYGGASVMAIAERAGVAAGTLYRHFASKEELFVEVFRSVCEREERAMRAAAAELPDDAPPRRSGWRRCWPRSRERALRNPRLAWALIAEPVDPRVDAERLAYRERYAALIAEGLAAGIAAGELPEQNVDADRGGAGRRLRRGAGRAAVAAGRRGPRSRRDRRGAADVRPPRGGRGVSGRARRWRAVVTATAARSRTVLAVAPGAAQRGRRPDGARRWPRRSAPSTADPERGGRRARTARAACSAPAPT